MRNILVVVLVVACATPKTATEQAKAAADGAHAVGEIDGSLQPIGDRGHVAVAANSRMQIHLKDVSADTACMIFTEYKPVLFDERSKDIAAQLERDAPTLVVVAGATDSLKTFKWPDQSAGVKGKLVEAKRINLPSKDADGNLRDSWYVDFTVEWCAPLPAISPTTKFLTVSMFQAGKEAPSLFVWRIKGTPVATAGTQRVAPTNTTETSSEPSSKPAVTSGNTVLDWLRSKRDYTKFLEIAAAAGMEQELTKGNVIVFAAYDTLFSRSTFDELVADKSRSLALINDSIVDGTLTKQQLVEKQSVTLTTRSGKQVVLTYDAKKKRPFLDGKSLDRQIVEASNGTIFIRDTPVR